MQAGEAKGEKREVKEGISVLLLVITHPMADYCKSEIQKPKCQIRSNPP